MIIGHQFVILTVDVCVQHDGREVPRRAGLSASVYCIFIFKALFRFFDVSLITCCNRGRNEFSFVDSEQKMA